MKHILEKWVQLQGKRAHSLKFFVCMIRGWSYQQKKENRRKKNHRLNNLPWRQSCRDVASGADKHLDITFGLQVVESSSLVSVPFREAFNHPYISFFQLLVSESAVALSM